MMKILIHAGLVAALLCFAIGVAASPTIELKDGSRIQGEIQGVENGMYIVVSPSLGTVRVAQSNITRIVYSGDVANAADSSGKASPHDDTVTHDIQQLQTRMAQDPAAIQSIMSLQSDPQIQAILNDPAIMKAIQDGDYASLLGNAKIRALDGDEHLKQVLQQQSH